MGLTRKDYADHIKVFVTILESSETLKTSVKP